MSVPTYEKFMFPILKILSDGQIKSKKSIAAAIIEYFHFNERDLNETLPSQSQPTYLNRMGWAITYLKKAELLISPSRACFQITNEGRKIVEGNVTNLDSKYLRRYKSFIEFQKLSHKQDTEGSKSNNPNPATPLENMIDSYELIKKDVCDEILSKILEQSSDFFEQLVVDLIVAMGYGGSIEDA